MTPAFLDNFHKIHPYWSSSAQDQKTTQKKYKTYLKGEKKDKNQVSVSLRIPEHPNHLQIKKLPDFKLLT